MSKFSIVNNIKNEIYRTFPFQREISSFRFFFIFEYSTVSKKLNNDAKQF